MQESTPILVQILCVYIPYFMVRDFADLEMIHYQNFVL